MLNILAFIGFGEAAFHIAKGLKNEGLEGIVAFDVNQENEKYGPLIKARAEEAGVILAPSLEEVCGSATLIASLTSADVAYSVGESVIPKLSAGQVFIDMNSAAPEVKAKIGTIDRAEGVLICDVAIMGTVPGNGHKVKMLLSGDGAKPMYDGLSSYGMKLEVLDSDLGGASAIKMFKSVVMKGLPQLMFESMYPALKYGALDALVKSLNDSLCGKTIEELANTFFARTIIHARRRASEMENVVATIEDMGLDASMSKSAKAKLEWLDQEELKEKIGTDVNMDFRKVLSLLSN